MLFGSKQFSHYISPRPGLQPRAVRIGIVAKSFLLGEDSVRVGILLFSHASTIPGVIGLHPPTIDGRYV